jgi:hypothetical protein
MAIALASTLKTAFGDTTKSKYFMTVLRAIVTKMTATWRFDSARFFNLLLSSHENDAGVYASEKRLTAARMPNQIHCRANKACYHLIARGACGSFKSERFENRRRTRKSAAVCALATLSKRWSGCNS